MKLRGAENCAVEGGVQRIPIVQTSYNYDALDNLTGVIQSGMTTPSGCPSGVSRCFAYDSLSRLKSANNPESGSTNYGYDPGGNLISKADLRFTTTFGIDAFGRVTAKGYTDPATPGVNYCYDGQSWSNGQCSGTPSAPSIGRTTQVLSSVSSNTYSYDTLGRVTASSQTTGSTPYSFQYSYNAAGLLTSETYPSNRVVSYAYNAVGRTKTVAGVLGTTTIPYAGDVNNPIAYVPHGAISSLKLGNGIVETTTYNARLQPTSIQAGSLMTLGYTYGTTQNNGNVLSQTITRGSQAWSQTYSYTDGLNRLTGASESGSGSWSQTYGYDNFGNRWLSGYTNLPSPSNQVPNGNWFLGNKILNSPSGAWTYDNAGNLQAMAGMPGWSFTYDAENRQITSVTASSPTTTYQYDGEGRRVTKNWNGQTTTFVYDAFGNLAAEYGGPVGSTGTQYLTSDHLGSTRLVTDSSGASVNCYDYLPFGEEIGSGTAGRPSSCFGSGSYPAAGGATNVEFTSKERDAESGLDFFGARYMSSAQGRFTSVDPAYESEILELPQTWNRYSYVYNRPTFATDPDGRCPPCIGAIVGGVVEGGFDLGKQFIQNGYTFNGTNWREVGANVLGGAATGALAVATGGTSILASAAVGDVIAGGTGAVVGGIVTRAAEGKSADDVLSLGDLSEDALAGFTGGGAGHVAGEMVHIPGEPFHNGRNSVGAIRRDNAKFAKYNQAVQNQIVRATVTSSAATDATKGLWDFALPSWKSFLMFGSSPQPPPTPPPPALQPVVSSTICYSNGVCQ